MHMDREQENSVQVIELPQPMRQLIENVIEDLLLLLDEIDGDADCETFDPDREDGLIEEYAERVEYGDDSLCHIEGVLAAKYVPPEIRPRLGAVQALHITGK